MALDILIVNPHSAEFFYLPVGTLAIADYLRSHDLEVAVLNLPSYGRDEAMRRLDKIMVDQRPKAVGLILHWKEVINGFTEAGSYLARSWPETPIWVGGITASAFAEELLRRFYFAEGVIVGDAELPLLALCRGAFGEEVPNLTYRINGVIRTSTSHWCANAAFLSRLRYGQLDLLLDIERYLKRVDSRLGLPLAPGRGCVFDCGYCGGSREAFRWHSGRAEMAIRSPRAVVEDLAAAYEHGARNFLLSHLTGVAEGILDEVRRRFGEAPPFSLNLEPWGRPSQRLLEKYAAFRWATGNTGRFLLLTLRGAPTAAARVKERDAVLGDASIALKLDEQLLVTLFSGYFSPWHDTRGSLDEELEFSCRVRGENWDGRMSYSLMAFSTDPGNHWSAAGETVGSPLTLGSIAEGAMRERAVTNNLLLHRPAGLVEAEAEAFLAAWHLDDRLHCEAREMWCLLTGALSFQEYRRVLQEMACHLYVAREGQVYPVGESGTGAMLGVVRASAARLLEGVRGEVTAEFARLLIAAHRAAVVPHAAVDVLEMEDFLIVDPEAWIEIGFDLGPLVEKARAGARISAEDVTRAAASRGRFLHLLRPSISAAMPVSELELLRAFDGATATVDAAQALQGLLGAPMDAVTLRVEQLRGERMLVPVRSATSEVLCV